MTGRAALLALVCGLALSAAPADRPAQLGADGVLRWTDSGGEVALFGVNYYAPFAGEYTRIKEQGTDHRQAIRDDLEHFRRLGLDAIRLHCWDREISDRQGNLLDNEHLELLDYLLAEARRRGIYAVLTPIAWWGTATPCDGFSVHYTMPRMTTEAEPRAAQCRFLGQFVNHVNRFTGLSYRDDPAVIAFEVINEPLYPPGTTDAQVTEYIDALVGAVRDTGCTKPVAYNCWQDRHQAAADSRCDAVTFGWYPTGLVNGRMIPDDCLPRVDRHPAMGDPRLANRFKLVYEFDAADVQGSYLYPAMARAFRTGGMQIATQFQYDPLCVSAGNPGWQTHFLNLAYTPGKAISFAIAAEVFRTLPRGRDYGAYPANTRFGAARVSFPEDLSEFVTDTLFLHSNTTATAPPAPDRLERIAGCGSSPAVECAGGGAYFLDRVSPDCWLLQAYPAAVLVDDPYRGGSNEKVRLVFDPIRFRLRLPGWEGALTVQSTQGDAKPIPAAEGTFTVAPGEYLLVRTGTPVPARPTAIPAFVPPPPVDLPPAARIDAPAVWREGLDLPVRVTVAGQEVRDCQLRFLAAGDADARTLPLAPDGPHAFAATIPADWLKPGPARFEVRATSRYQDRWLTLRFPGGLERDLRLGGQTAGPVTIPLPSTADRLEIHGSEDVAPPAAGGSRQEDDGTTVIRLESGGFGPPPSCARVTVKELAVPAGLDLVDEVWLELRGAPATHKVEVGFRLADGRAFGQDMALTPNWGGTVLPVAGLRGLWGTQGKPELAGLTELRLTYGSWLLGTADREHWLELRSLTLIPGGEGMAVDIRPASDPVALVEPGITPPHVRGSGARTVVIGGDRIGRRAARILVNGFEPPPACASARLSVSAAARQPFAERQPTTVVVVARAAEPATDRFELTLIEADGAPWGTTVKITPEWQEIRLPLADFTFFKHWPHPQARGGEGDAPQGADIRSVGLCFGAWQYPETRTARHGFDIQSVGLE